MSSLSDVVGLTSPEVSPITKKQDHPSLGQDTSSSSLGGSQYSVNRRSLPDLSSGELPSSDSLPWHPSREDVSTSLERVQKNYNEYTLSSDHDSSSIPEDMLSLQNGETASLTASLRPSANTKYTRPFDERFTAPLSGSSRNRALPSSPAIRTSSSRHSSLTSKSDTLQFAKEEEVPWKVVQWTKLKKISHELFSEVGRRNYGRPTCISVSSIIAIGTSKGLILIFDYHQSLKATIGVGTKATECGSVTSVALSADHSTVASGYADGSVFTWEVARPAKPFLHLPSVPSVQLLASKGNGHIKGVSILHIGFLGTRHTALVTADDKGMAFSHLATRGMGPISRSVHTTRLLGRYPDLNLQNEHGKKPSSVLAFSPLPLGSVESSTDALGLVAMLTPYLLVIVSTTPIAQTQHKASRPKELAPHGALSAALAWYPPMRSGASATEKTHENAKLAYCWLNIVTILEVVELETSDDTSRDRPPEFEFKFKKRWECSESIVAMQWLSTSVLTLVTITQKLLILDTTAARVVDSSDLLSQRLYHVDFFSDHLSQLVETLDEENVSMHGVVADAFYMSFRAYKGRLFLLGFNDISMGTLSNWADRLVALVEAGDFIAAINLATVYYSDDQEHTSIGLPDDRNSRRSLVRERLLEMMRASLSYTFRTELRSQSQMISREFLETLIIACFEACLTLNDMEFIYDEVFEWYADSGQQAIFYKLLEQHVLHGTIKTIPPAVLKCLVDEMVMRNQNKILEEMLCRLNPDTMDLDQITSLCYRHHLYDALLYVWSKAIGDHVTILESLLNIAESGSSGSEQNSQVARHRIFPYLTYTLTGRVYPTGQPTSDDESMRAKVDIYYFILSNKDDHDNLSKPKYTNLKRLVNFDSASFFVMLNEAFEDSFFNEQPHFEPHDKAHSTIDDKVRFKLSLNRQYILNVLRQVVVAPEHKPDDILYLDMFIARNRAKYPQFILLSLSTMHKILLELCQYGNKALAEDCQLSVEYLLSFYQPPDLPSLIPQLMEARFFRVIKSIYRAEKQYSLLLQTCFNDIEDDQGLFNCIGECLSPKASLTQGERQRVEAIIVNNASSLLQVSLVDSSKTIENYAPMLHRPMINALANDEYAKYVYLRQFMEPKNEIERMTTQKPHTHEFVEIYIHLLCKYNFAHVATYVDGLSIHGLQLDSILPTLQNSGAIDAAIMLMARGDRLGAAFEKLISHLNKLGGALIRFLYASDEPVDTETPYGSMEDLVALIERYNAVGIWLCQRQTKAKVENLEDPDNEMGKTGIEFSQSGSHGLMAAHELLWLDLIDVIVGISKNSTKIQQNGAVQSPIKYRIQQDDLDDRLSEKCRWLKNDVTERLKGMVHRTFNALLISTGTRKPGLTESNAPFLRILRSFLSRASASSPSLSHLRSVLATIFSSYTYEEELLGLAHRLLDKDLFVHVEEISTRRKKGWRPLGQTCGACGGRVWGPGVGGNTWYSWAHHARSYGMGSSTNQRADLPDYRSAPSSVHAKGKGRAALEDIEQHVNSNRGNLPWSEERSPEVTTEAAHSLVIFSCRHIFHSRCLESVYRQQKQNQSKDMAEHRDSTSYCCPLELS